jgi:hypothetical protein
MTARLIPFGPLPDNAAAEAFRPPDLRGIHSPVVLASDGNGHVALALNATSAVRVYNAGRGTFTDVPLPRASDAWSLRYFDDGGLAIGLVSYTGAIPTTAVIATPDGSLSQPINVGDSELVSPYSDNAVLFGGVHPTILKSDGTTHPIALPRDVHTYTPLGGVQGAPNATLVIPTESGISFLDGPTDAVVTATYEYPTTDERCGPSSGLNPHQRPGVGCQGVVPARVAVGGDGAVWLLKSLAGTPTHVIIERIDRR